LNGGERVIVDNAAQFAPGTVVKPVDARPAHAAPGAAASGTLGRQT
jgi:multidrug efflux system membrane fusion protein